jgi:hypothetical protein
MVEGGFQDLVGEILEREQLAYREPIVDAGFQDAGHYLESVSSQEISCEKHKCAEIKSIGLFLLEKVGPAIGGGSLPRRSGLRSGFSGKSTGVVMIKCRQSGRSLLVDCFDDPQVVTVRYLAIFESETPRDLRGDS